MENLKQEVLANIDREELIRLTKELCAIDTQNPPADYSISSEYMKKLYEELGLETCVFQGEGGKPNVGARWCGTGEKAEKIMFSGHMDVVPVGTGWHITNPLKVEEKDDYLYGRGVVDMKGSLIAQYLAVKALKKANINIKGDLYLFSTVDDETAGKMGLKYIINEGLDIHGWAKPSFHILGEPTDLNLCTAFKGRMWIRIAVKGKSAHGGNPKAGINAIEKMMAFLKELLALPRMSHALMGEDTINIGTIEAGSKTNVVPDSCVVTIDYRYVAPQSSQDIESKIKSVIDGIMAHDSDFVIEKFEVFERREPLEVDQTLGNMQVLKSITETVKGSATKFSGVLSAGDSYWTITNSIPAVFFGPGSMSVAHTSKECINITELENACKIFALFALEKLA